MGNQQSEEMFQFIDEDLYENEHYLDANKSHYNLELRYNLISSYNFKWNYDLNHISLYDLEYDSWKWY